jgi:hypothetical protein
MQPGEAQLPPVIQPPGEVQLDPVELQVRPAVYHLQAASLAHLMSVLLEKLHPTMEEQVKSVPALMEEQPIQVGTSVIAK